MIFFSKCDASAILNAGTLVGGKIFARCVGDLTICQVGLWSGLIGLTLVAFGDSTGALFSGRKYRIKYDGYVQWRIHDL